MMKNILLKVLCLMVTFTFFPLAAQAEFTNKKVTFSADKIKSLPHQQASLLSGNVRLKVGKVTISGNKMLIKYADARKQSVVESIIYGNGILEDGPHAMAFKNGVFNTKTLQITADQTKPIK